MGTIESQDVGCIIMGRRVIKYNAGREVSSGVYFNRLEAGEFVETKKMVLLR